jgi:TonB-dependent receptor
MGLVAPVLAQDATGDLEEVVVTGLRGTIKSAQDIKFGADTFVDSIVADDIANLPDRSVVETLQRIPGVTIDRFISRGDPEHLSGEGVGVSIRGLTQVQGLLNGREGFTANGGRTLSFEDVPPELMAGVDVYKNQTAEMIEGGLGGNVDLRTRMPLDIDERLIAFTATANYQNFIEETTPGFSALYSDRWDTGIGEVGFLVDLAYSELEGQVDILFNRPLFPRDDVPGTSGTVWTPPGVDWRRETTYRERTGTYAALQLRPDDNSEYFLTIFNSSYEFTWDENALFISNDPYTVFSEDGPNGPPVNATTTGDWEFDGNGVFQRGTLSGWSFDDTDGDGTQDTWNPLGMNFGSDVRIATRESDTTDISLGGEWNLGNDWVINADLQYVKATTKALDSTIGGGLSMPPMYVDVSGDLPIVQADQQYLSDPANFFIGFTMDHQDDNEAEQTALKVDAERTLNHDFIRSVKFGARLANRDQTLINTGYNWRAVIQPWMRWWALSGTDPLPNMFDIGLTDDQIDINRFENFFRGELPIPGAVVAPDVSLAAGYPDSYYTIHNGALPYYLPGSGFFTIDPDTGERVTAFAPTLINPSHRNEQEQDVQSLYAIVRFGQDDGMVDGNVGLRWVKTESSASGFIVFPDVSSLPNDPALRAVFQQPDMAINVVNEYEEFLPSFNLRARLTDELLARVAWSRAMHRPDFSSMRGYTALQVNLADGAPDGSTNPNDYNGSALDAGNPNLKPMTADMIDLSLEWYYSDIGSAWVNLFSKNIKGFIRDQLFTETYNGFDYDIVRPANQDSAYINGWELGWRQFFDSGFGVEAAYTRLYSRTAADAATIPVDTDGTVYPADSMPYEGLSKNSYTITGMFENNLISARLAYTWRSEFLLGVGANGYRGSFNGVDWRLPVFQDDYGQWDGSIFFNLTDNFALGLEANNLTNEEIRTVQKQITAGNNTASASVTDTRYALTLRANF